MTQIPSSRPGAAPAPGTASGQTAGDLMSDAQGSLGQAVDQAQSAAGQVTQQAKQQATSQLESQKGRAVDTLVTVAQALRQTGQSLQQQEQTAVGGYVEQAAERVERLTNHLRARDVPQLVAETQAFARRQPGLFITGAIALGFLGARFLRTSGERATAQQPAFAGNSSSFGRPSTYGMAPAGAYPDLVDPVPLQTADLPGADPVRTARGAPED